jgi:hypothetical protein
VSLIHCTSDCQYQNDGYCRLETAAEISAGPNYSDCLHFKAKEPRPDSLAKREVDSFHP